MENIRKIENLLEACDAGLALASWDETLRFEYASSSLCRMLGWTREEFARLCGSFQQLPWAGEEDVFRRVRSQLEKEGEYSCEFPLRCRDGSELWVLSRGRRAHRAFHLSLMSSPPGSDPRSAPSRRRGNSGR